MHFLKGLRKKGPEQSADAGLSADTTDGVSMEGAHVDPASFLEEDNDVAPSDYLGGAPGMTARKVVTASLGSKLLSSMGQELPRTFDPYEDADGAGRMPLRSRDPEKIESVMEPEDDEDHAALRKGTDESMMGGQSEMPPGGTTLMIRNLPNDYTREDLVALLDDKGFRSLYDFLYLPKDVSRKAGKGYAFVNFVDHDSAVRCQADLTGFCDWSKKGSKKTCVVDWGDKQGLEWAVEKYRNHWTNNDSVADGHKPMLFKNGSRVPFPPPSKRVRPPPGSSGAQDGAENRRGSQASFTRDRRVSWTANEPQHVYPSFGSVVSPTPPASFGGPPPQSFGGPDQYFEERDKQFRARWGPDYNGCYYSPDGGPIPPAHLPPGYPVPPVPPVGFGPWGPMPAMGLPPFPPMDPAAAAIAAGGGAGLSPEQMKNWAKQLFHMAEMQERAAEAVVHKVSSRRSSRTSDNRPRGESMGIAVVSGAASSSSVAKRPTDQSEEVNDEGDLDPSEFTTIMFRNIPNDYTRDDLRDLMNANGFEGSFDFLYLPIDFGRSAGKGYAFINFVSNAEAVRFQEIFEGFKAWKNGSKKAAQLEWGVGSQQGLEANKKKYRDSPLMHPEVPDKYKPVLFENGERVEFPPPTKVLKRPRHFQIGNKAP